MAAVVCALLVGLLYFSVVPEGVLRTGLDWPVWIDHPEGLMNTTLGRWWVLPPHRYLVDGASGEFPIYYQSLSDSILNLVAEPLGAPAMTVQRSSSVRCWGSRSSCSTTSRSQRWSPIGVWHWSPAS
jgi:hypothetical protein